MGYMKCNAIYVERALVRMQIYDVFDAIPSTLQSVKDTWKSECATPTDTQQSLAKHEFQVFTQSVSSLVKLGAIFSIDDTKDYQE